jgi:ribosomal protein S21
MNPKQYKKHQAILPGAEIGVRVLKHKERGLDIERALRNWKKQVKDADIVSDLKDRMQYEKKSIARREKMKRARFIAKIQQQNQ